MDHDPHSPESPDPSSPEEESASGDAAPGDEEFTAAEREALDRLGYSVLPEMVEELAAPAARERDVAAVAGEGSGKEALYALVAARRLRPDSPDLQCLVLTPTDESAGRVCRHLYELAGPEGIHALGWTPEVAGEGEARPLAQVVAGRPAPLMEAIQAGRLGIDGLSLLILDGIAVLRDTDDSGAMDEILDTADSETQVIAVSHRPDPEFRKLAERRLSRTRRWPRELFREDELPKPSGPPLAWGAAPTFDERVDLLARGLRAAVPDEPAEVLVHCGSQTEARRVAGALAGRGFHIASESGEPGVGVAWGEDEAPEGGVSAWFGLPSGLPGLRRTAGPAARRVAVVTPGETAQLRLLARRAGWPLEALPGAVPEGARDRIARYRDEVSRRADEVDESIELLLLEPVVQDRGLASVAAALSAWVRERRMDGEAPAEPVGPADGADEHGPRAQESGTGKARAESRTQGPRDTRDRREQRPKRKTPEQPWTRLFIPVGERDDVRPADLVGAITGETDAVGGQIGKIDIRDSYSLVDVESGVADHVINGLSGATIRGRRVEVRRDRNA